jgi:hypothetical protein
MDASGFADGPAVEPAPAPDVAIDARAADVAWLASLSRERGFRSLSLAESASPLVLTWRLGTARRAKAPDPAEDYPGNHVAKLDLVFQQGAHDTRLDLGEHSGSPVPSAMTYCKRSGYGVASGDAWGFPTVPNLVSAFSVAIPQGSSDYVLLLGDDRLFVLHRETDDGDCTELKQGPLRTCVHMQYALLAEVRLAQHAPMRERILWGADGQAPDCGAESEGVKLTPPSHR